MQRLVASRAKRCRVHRTPPRVRDDRDTPLCGVGCESCRFDLGQVGTEIFFGKPEIGLDSPVNKPPDGQITTRAQAVIARLDRATQYSRAPVIESRGCGVLDTRFRG